MRLREGILRHYRIDEPPGSLRNQIPETLG